jgi:hypothetical protein
MDMTEKVLSLRAAGASDEEETTFLPQSRMIQFKCVESPFFSEFDGEWKVVEQLSPEGKVESVVSYEVEVRPRGPVPVAALEWRIREDVPTNLRAVKRAALTVGYKGVMAERRLENPERVMKRTDQTRMSPAVVQKAMVVPPTLARNTMVTKLQVASFPGVDWGDDETMAAYLKKGP